MFKTYIGLFSIREINIGGTCFTTPLHFFTLPHSFTPHLGHTKYVPKTKNYSTNFDLLIYIEN